MSKYKYKEDFELPASSKGGQIANARSTILAISTGTYKNSAYALSEIIDNSIDNKAKKIDIITVSALGAGQGKKGRRIEKITEIAVLDDGTGMDDEVFRNCLSLGYGTNLDGSNLDAHGKFGYGLKGSSLFSCGRVEIFTWQNGAAPKVVYLDKETIKDDQQNLAEPARMDIPDRYKKLAKDTLNKSGTLVIWKKLNQDKFPKKAEAFHNVLKADVCRIYRHFLDNDDAYGGKLDISLTQFNKDGEKEVFPLKPNDPLFIMSPNIISGANEKYHEATSIQEALVPLPIEYEENEYTTVDFVCSVAKKEIQSEGGNAWIGKEYEKHNSISFLRRCREIDFDSKGYITHRETDRWFGIEVRFSPEADQIFGVTKEKTQVQNIKNFTTNQISELDEDIAEAEEFHILDETYYRNKALREIHRVLTGLVKQLKEVVEARGKGTRTKSPTGTGGLIPRIGGKGGKVKKNTKTRKSDQEAEGKSDSEKKEEIKKQIKSQFPELTEKELDEYADQQLDILLSFSEKSWAGSLFVDKETIGNANTAIINTSHPFYVKFYQKISEIDDPELRNSLTILILSFIEAENELELTIDDGHLLFEKIRENWGQKLKAWLPEA